MKASSSAALGTLTVPSKSLASDPVLQLVIAKANELQLTVKTPNGKNAATSLELPSGTILSQRNAILRCLAGMGMHNALDETFLGGHCKRVAASPTHALAMASISSWMSVADHAKKEKSIGDLLEQLESHLSTRAFLVPSASCTLADLDVAIVVFQKAKNDFGAYPNVARWMGTCVACFKSNGIDCNLTKSVAPLPQAAPMFFYGNEENVALPKQKAGPPAGAGKKQGGQDQQKGGGKQQNQQQQQQQGGKKNKKEGKKNKQPQQPQAPATFDVTALDIRVGKILKAWPHETAEKLYCEEIDVGEDKPRQIASGLRPFYSTEEMMADRKVLVLCNLKKRNLVGFPSHGMVLCASNADHTAVQLMEAPADAKIGERVKFEGMEDKDPEPENKVAKKKIFESVAPDLKTNAEGACVWKTHLSQTSAGPIKASKGMADAQVA